MTSIVFKISDNLKDELLEHYKDTLVDNKPPYSVFQSKDYGTTVTLYESGKLLIQGVSADIDYAWWKDREKFLNNRDLDKEIKGNDKTKSKDTTTDFYRKVSTIGSDEVGTGDYFGPIVVASTYVDVKDIPLLKDLGVRDSKKLTDTKILEIAPTLIKSIPNVVYILTPKDYNDKGITNMNKVKAILHNKVLYTLVNKDNYDYKYIIVDQFTPPKNYFTHIYNVTEKITKIKFITHAEDQCYAVGAASIISRYIFLKEMDKLSEKYKMTIPRGASNKVDEFGKEFVLKYGLEELNNVAKLNFKNTDKIKELL